MPAYILPEMHVDLHDNIGNQVRLLWSERMIPKALILGSSTASPLFCLFSASAKGCQVELKSVGYSLAAHTTTTTHPFQTKEVSKYPASAAQDFMACRPAFIILLPLEIDQIYLIFGD